MNPLNSCCSLEVPDLSDATQTRASYPQTPARTSQDVSTQNSLPCSSSASSIHPHNSWVQPPQACLRLPGQTHSSCSKQESTGFRGHAVNSQQLESYPLHRSRLSWSAQSLLARSFSSSSRCSHNVNPSSSSTSSSSSSDAHGGRTPRANSSSVDAQESAKFAALASQWWDTQSGPFAPLHALNPARCRFIRKTLCSSRGLPQDSAEPLKGLSIVDVGCGGGILCEPLARMGGRVLGIDLSDEGLAVAEAHAAGDPALQSRIR